MGRARRTALAALLGVAGVVAVAASSGGCEEIRHVPGDGGEVEDGGGAWLATFGPSGQLLRAPADGGFTTMSVLGVTVIRGGEGGPLRIDITSSDASVVSVAGDALIIPEGSTTFMPVPLDSSATGTAQLTAKFDGGEITVSVTVLPTVLISEVAAASTGNPDDEFVELYNPTSLDFSLAGYVLQYHSSNDTGTPYLNVCTLGSNAHIAPHGYYLIGVNQYSRAEDFHATWMGGAFSGNGGSVRLGAPGIGTGKVEGLTLDTVGWGQGANGAWDFEARAVAIPSSTFWGSVERKAKSDSTELTMGVAGPDHSLGNGVDTEDNSADFITRTIQEPQTSAAGTEP